MRKILALAAAIMMMFALVSCGSPTEEQPEEQIDYEIALVTDAGLIMDGGYSEVAWTAISQFGAENGISHKYYKAAEATEESYRAAIDDAAAKGAKVVIADGYGFEDVIYEVQNEYEDIDFILIDAEPVDSESGEAKIADNTTAILFSSEEAGYMAGYAAVQDGYTQLGFIGEADKKAVDDYGYGFLQGADAAASAQGISVNVKSHYCSSDEGRESVVERASKWYASGTEVIFACGSQVEMPIIESAEICDGRVIACETDKSGMSDTIITSAIKDISGVLEDVLKKYGKDKFPGGEVAEYDTSTDSISLNMETSRFKDFGESNYKELRRNLANKDVEVEDSTVGEISTLQLGNVDLSEE